MADMVHGEEEGNDDEEMGEEEEEDYEVEESEEEDNENEEEPTETLEEHDEENRSEEKEGTEGDVCFHCHQPGHKARKCPLLHPELKKEPRMKEKKNITDLQIRDRVIHFVTINS